MASYIKDNLKQHCSGCGACVQACGVGAITLEQDIEGFSYPLVDENKCVNCNKCVSVCPFEGTEKNDYTQRFFAVKSKSSGVIKSSSSGGAFYEITKAFCDENYAVFGAEMNSQLKVCHSFTEDIKDINKFQKSKYVQSETGNTFKKAKELLNKGVKVLYSGTPCQIAGLKKFLGKDYENLITVDIVCHGVPSQSLFDKYIKELSKKLKSQVVSFTFRNKKDFDKKSCNQKTAFIKTADGKEYVKEVLECEYLAGFHEALFYRPSCAECPFAGTQRQGDITLADFWGAEKYYKDFDDGKGVSLVIVNSEKGLALFEKSDFEKIETDKEKAIERNAQLRHPVVVHKNRDKFFEMNSEATFCKSVKECMDFPSTLRYKLYKIKTKLK